MKKKKLLEILLQKAPSQSSQNDSRNMKTKEEETVIFSSADNRPLVNHSRYFNEILFVELKNRNFVGCLCFGSQMKVDGKVALITGGASGLGKAYSEALLQKGAKVIFLDVDQEKGKQTLLEFTSKFGKERVAFEACDVTNSNALRAAFQKAKKLFGRLDIVCNNAGMGNEEAWRLMLNINLVSVIEGTFIALEEMKSNPEGGVIVNIASMGGLMPMPFSPVYCGSKYGVLGFTQSIALTAQEQNIRVNCLCPSFTQTPMLEKGMAKHQLFAATINRVGILSAELVAEGFMQLVEDDTKIGAVMRVTQAKGIDYLPNKPQPKL